MCALARNLRVKIRILISSFPPADYDIEEIQDALLAYDGEINILVAPKDYINKRMNAGPVALSTGVSCG